MRFRIFGVLVEVESNTKMTKLESRPLTADDIEDLKSLYGIGLDVSIIKAIYYFDGWSDYEEHGGYLIFQGIDDSIQFDEYGYCVYSSGPTHFEPYEIDETRALELIAEMDKAIQGDSNDPCRA